MKKQLVFLSVAAIVALSACGNTVNQVNDEKKNVKEQSTETNNVSSTDKTENEVKDIKQLVYDYSNDKLTAEGASITSTQLIVTNNDNSQSTYDLPKDEFFVSIAPYIEKTHPCGTHNLIGCQGEKKNEEFDVHIEDSEGNIIIDETLKSNPHGFIDLWLPRDKEYQISITQNEKMAELELSTFERDNTCITTMQLK